MNRLQTLQKFGQSLWLDFISRNLLASGELKRLVDQGITGVTSNPSIFQKSICETDDYAEIIGTSDSNFKTNAPLLYEKIAVEDIQMAADVLRPVYDATDGVDGLVSLEVSPHLAYQPVATICEAQRLWNLVNRPNLLIKVPATKEGIPAIESLTACGVNVNATLIFSVERYREVAMAYIQGLEKCAEPRRLASVASFFVSRIDTAVDKLLEKNGSPQALAMRGKIAIASARMVYQAFKEIFYGAAFAEQRNRGARVQRIVWGSTGTKNPRYSDVVYVDEIIGPDTINTVPMPTLKAFLDHGNPRPSIFDDVEDAQRAIASLERFDISLASVTEGLEKEGVQAFVQAYDFLLESLQGRCNAA